MKNEKSFFNGVSSVQVSIKLPISLNKFIEPTEMNAEAFFTRWKNLSLPTQVGKQGGGELTYKCFLEKKNIQNGMASEMGEFPAISFLYILII